MNRFAEPLTPETLLKAMRGALAEEREGIQKMDADAIERANATKERVIKGLHEAPPERRGPLLDALDSLQPELRRNLILLTQARAYLAETQRERRHVRLEESALTRKDGAPASPRRIGSA